MARGSRWKRREAEDGAEEWIEGRPRNAGWGGLSQGLKRAVGGCLGNWITFPSVTLQADRTWNDIPGAARDDKAFAFKNNLTLMLNDKEWPWQGKAWLRIFIDLTLPCRLN